MLERAGEAERTQAPEEVLIQTQEPAVEADPEPAPETDEVDEGREDPFDAPVPESASGGYTNWWI